MFVTPQTSPHLDQLTQKDHPFLQSDPTQYRLIMMDVNYILPSSPLLPMLMAPSMPEQVCEMQTLALFTMAQGSPQLQLVLAATCSRVKTLPSPITSYSFSGELPPFQCEGLQFLREGKCAYNSNHYVRYY